MPDHPSTDLSFSTLTALLHHRATSAPHRRAYVHLGDGEHESDALTNASLEHRAITIANRLGAVASPGDRALLLYPAGLEFMAAFFGCLLAGVIAVPSYPPKRNRPDPRLQTIVDDAGARLVLTDTSVLAEIEPRLQNSPWLRALTWIATDSPTPAEAARRVVDLPIVQPDDLAFLQYTSGSTATPKGVMVSHANLLHNLHDLDQGWDHDESRVMITWLPIFHDMGLIYGALMPLFRGFLCVMLPPAAFLQRPIRWLEAISRYRGTHSAAPNFAYDLCVASTTAEQRAALNLSSWHLSLNAAEPVRAHTLATFNTAFAPCGLDPLTVKPGFGLAEATLKVSALPRAEKTTVVHLDATALARHELQEISPDHPNATAIVGCGWGQVDNRTLIVDPENHRPCPPDQVGEIWFTGPSVAQGYWQRPDATAETFHATLADGSGPWMRTGDLGFMRDREVFVTGRLKDLIILRGLNHYPQDIELTVERAHPSIRAGCTAAFSIESPAGGEALAVVAEIERTHLRRFDCPAVVAALRESVAANHELPLHTVVFLKPASIPKTSSGKIQRRLARQRLLNQEFAALASWTVTDQPSSTAPNKAKDIESFIRQTMASLLNVDLAQIDPNQPFVSQGLDSLTAVELSGILEKHLQRRLPPTLVYDFPHVRALAAHLTAAPEGSSPASPNPTSPSDEPIAIIGFDCRFPGADSSAAFWDLLTSGRDAITPVPSDRWDSASHAAPAWGGFIDHAADFDAEFFGLSAREADLIDPQHRVLLETSWHALEHAGIDPHSLAGSQTGVFIGISTFDYRLLLARSPQGTAPHTGTGNALSIAANRLSYILDLRGPSLALDTACSSALVALHHAVRSLRTGESELALVGGVNLLLAPDVSESFAAAGMLAPDGRCKTFDATADGYVRGEGAGVVILKTLSSAQRDGDRIFALVHGSAVNQDGRSNGLTAPNGPAQQAVIRSALHDAKVAPAAISFVETHGTGTALGDPIEVNSLRTALAVNRPPENPCLLGAVKTQIGHLEAAAGIAGLIKTVLSLHHGMIPGNLHLHQPNLHLADTAPTLAFPSANTAWAGTRRYAGISAFGFGGTNAHVILGAAPANSESKVPALSRPVEPYLISARNPADLRHLVATHTTHLQKLSASAWPDAAYTSAIGRAPFSHRVAVVAASAAEAATQLRDADMVPPPAHPPRIAFLFSGQGSLYAGAGNELRESSPVFAAALNECRELVTRFAGWDVIEVLQSAEKLTRTEFAQVALFSLEYSLAKLWQSWGIQPSAVAGHSVGEYAAAVIAGAMDLPSSLALLVTRARLMGALGETGAMAAIIAPVETVEALATQHGAEIGAYNSARQTVVTGSANAVNATVEAARSAGLRVAPLPVVQGYHSAEMDPMLAEFQSAARSTPQHPTNLSFVSSSTGKMVGPEILDADYWTNQIRQPVRWTDTAQSLANLGCDLVIEVGPRNLLAALTAQSWPDQPVQWLTSLQPGKSDWTTLLQSASQAWTRGAPIDWAAVHQGFGRKRSPLPTYPFQRARHWFTEKPMAAVPHANDQLAAIMANDPTLSPAERDAIPAVLAAWSRAKNNPDRTAVLQAISWHPEPLATAPSGLPGSWLVIGTDSSLGTQLISRGHTASTAPTYQSGDWSNVVHLTGRESANFECHRLLDTIRQLRRDQSIARLHVVTRAAVAVIPMDGRALHLPHAAVWGMGLSFALEQPAQWGGLIDLPPAETSAETTLLVDELLAASPEDQVALRPGRYVPRLEPIRVPTAKTTPLSADASYWITGGLGGIGMQIARWLIDQGARHLILSGRHAPTAEAQKAIDEWIGREIEVQTTALDAADAIAVNALLDAAAAADHPVRGIVHAAGIMHNQPLDEVTTESMDAVLHPKVRGGLVLHEATIHRDLDFLVFFSSIAAVWGSKWQLSYSAANRFLDALAIHRRAISLPATSINWGPWSGGGMAGAEEQQLLSRMGINALSSATNFAILRDVLAAETTQAVVAQVDWPFFRNLIELHRPKPLLSQLGQTTPHNWEEPLAIISAWSELDRAARPEAMGAWLQTELAAVLGFKAGQLPDPRVGFFDLGLDSILAVEFRNRLSRALGQSLPATLAFDHGYIIALADYLATKLWPPEAPAVTVLKEPLPAAPLSADATTEELDDALNLRLARLESLTRNQ